MYLTTVEPMSPRAYARAASRSGAEYACLQKLWFRESRWSPTARNPHSSAYGIAQLLHETSNDPITQVRQRYGASCVALQHSYRYGWY